MELKKIKVSELKVPKHNIRIHNPDYRIEDLKTSIKNMGLIEPITVFEESGTYVALIGQRRLLAYYELNEEFPGQGFDEIECIVRNIPDDDDLKRALSTGENITHLPMSKRDLERVVTDLYNKCGSYDLICRRFGLSRYMVDKYVGLSRLPEKIREAIKSGELGPQQNRAERIALAAADALQFVPGGRISEEKVLKLACMMARKANLKKEIINETKKNPLRNIDDIERRVDAKYRVPLHLYLSAELNTRLGAYSEYENYENREEAAVDIIAERLDAEEQ